MTPKILFLGQKPIGEYCFDLIVKAELRREVKLVGCVSNTDISNWWGTNEIYKRCLSLGIPFVSNQFRNEDVILELMRSVRPDYLVSVQHGWILPEPILALASSGAVNLHLAPLPRYQGYNCANHCILNGETEFGVTLHSMTTEVDRGDVLATTSIIVTNTETAISLYYKAEKAGKQLFEKFLSSVVSGVALASWPMIGPVKFYGRGDLEAHRTISLTNSPQVISRQARAFHFPPNRAAQFYIDGVAFDVVPTTLSPNNEED